MQLSELQGQARIESITQFEGFIHSWNRWISVLALVGVVAAAASLAVTGIRASRRALAAVAGRRENPRVAPQDEHYDVQYRVAPDRDADAGVTDRLMGPDSGED